MDNKTETEKPTIIIAEEGQFANCKGLYDLRRLIREGKVIIISDAMIEEFTQTNIQAAEEFRKAMRSLSFEAEVVKESLEKLINSFKISEHKQVELFPFVPIVQNYKKLNLIYNYIPDKRKYRASVNRR